MLDSDKHNNTVTLTQTNVFKREKKYEFVKNHYLRITSTVGKKSRDHTIDLIALSPEGVRERQIAWEWLVASISSFALVLVFIYLLMGELNIPSILLYVPLSLMCLVLAAVAGFMFWARSASKRVFYSNFGHHPLVELIENKPGREDYENFYRALEGRIRHVRDDYRMISIDKLKAGELKMLRRLKGKGLLSDKEYQELKETIFGSSYDPVSEEVNLTDSLEHAG